MILVLMSFLNVDFIEDFIRKNKWTLILPINGDMNKASYKGCEALGLAFVIDKTLYNTIISVILLKTSSFCISESSKGL